MCVCVCVCVCDCHRFAQYVVGDIVNEFYPTLCTDMMSGTVDIRLVSEYTLAYVHLTFEAFRFSISKTNVNFNGF